MGMTITEKDYRKVVFDTENPFVANKFMQFIQKNKFPSDCTTYGRHGYWKYTMFLTDEQLEQAEKTFFGILEYCGEKMQSLKEKIAFLSAYFDAVDFFQNTSVGLTCSMDAWGCEIVSFYLYCKEDDISWERLLKAVKAKAEIDVNCWFYSLRDRYLFSMEDKTTEDLIKMAEEMHKKLEDCTAAIEKKIKEEKA